MVLNDDAGILNKRGVLTIIASKLAPTVALTWRINMNTVTLYTTETCPYCRSAKSLLAGKGITMQEINVQRAPGKLEEMVKRSGRRTVPQIFIGDTHIGGFDDLAKLDRQGGLMPLLA